MDLTVVFLMYMFIIALKDFTYRREVADKLNMSFFNCQKFSENSDNIFNEMRHKTFDSVFFNGNTEEVGVTV